MPSRGGSIAVLNSTVLDDESCGAGAVRVSELDRSGPRRHRLQLQKVKERAALSVFSLSYEGIRHFMAKWPKEVCVRPYLRALKTYVRELRRTSEPRSGTLGESALQHIEHLLYRF
eukprot:scaffold1912_cov332-Prasinococcus_capsulatus_cf.AAC.3